VHQAQRQTCAPPDYNVRLRVRGTAHISDSHLCHCLSLCHPQASICGATQNTAVPLQWRAVLFTHACGHTHPPSKMAASSTLVSAHAGDGRCGQGRLPSRWCARTTSTDTARPHLGNVPKGRVVRHGSARTLMPSRLEQFCCLLQEHHAVPSHLSTCQPPPRLPAALLSTHLTPTTSNPKVRDNAGNVTAVRHRGGRR